MFHLELGELLQGCKNILIDCWLTTHRQCYISRFELTCSISDSAKSRSNMSLRNHNCFADLTNQLRQHAARYVPPLPIVSDHNIITRIEFPDDGKTSKEQEHHQRNAVDVNVRSMTATGTPCSVTSIKRKRSWSRAVFSNLQRKGLEKRFVKQKYITKPDRRQLAASLGLTDAQVR